MFIPRARQMGRILAAAFWAVSSTFAYGQQAPAPTTLPQNGQVTAGSAAIAQTGTTEAPALTITQSSQRAALSWSSFDLGANASVKFNQPDASSVTLNRIQSNEPSQIFGRISANGQIYLINPSGLYFSPTASVDVGGLVATTMTMSDDEFMSGHTTFKRNGSTGSVINEGSLQSASGGYIALLAPELRNAGVVTATAGTVALAAGDAIALTVDSANSLTSIYATPTTVDTLIENRKIVKADDGQVIVSAQAYNELTAGVIKNSGTISAKGITKRGGTITIGASSAIEQSGTLNVSSKTGQGGKVALNAKQVTQGGAIKAKSKATGSTGGTVEITGDALVLSSSSKIDARGKAGGGTVLVGGDWQGWNNLYQATTVTMDKGAVIDASATENGNGGKVVLWSDISKASGLTSVSGSIIASGGFHGGDGGQVETSGYALAVDGAVTTGKNGQWLLDPANITISSSADSNLSNGGTTLQPTSAATTTVINTTTLSNALASGDVTVTTTNTGTAAASAGTITVSSAITGSTGALSLIAASNITINAGITLSGSGKALLFKSAGAITVAAGVTMQTNNGNMILWANSAAGNTTNAITINSGATTTVLNTANGVTGQSSGGGKLILAGGLDDGSNSSTANDGIPDGYAYSTSTSGVTLGTLTYGLNLQTGGGDVIIRGRTTAASAAGINQTGGLTLNSGTGRITMDGISSSGAGIGLATGINNSLISIQSSAPSSAISLSGTSGSNYGIVTGYQANVSNASGYSGSTIAVQSLGGGSLTLTGRSTGTATGLTLNDISLLSSSGQITIDGGSGAIDFQNNTASNTNQRQVTIGSCATCDATTATALGLYTGTSTANVSLIANSGSFPSSAVNRIDTTGTVSILPYTSSSTTSIDPTYFSFTNNVPSITVNASGSSSLVTLSKALSINGALTIYGAKITQSNSISTGGDLKYYSSGQIALTSTSSSISAKSVLLSAGAFSGATSPLQTVYLYGSVASTAGDIVISTNGTSSTGTFCLGSSCLTTSTATISAVGGSTTITSQGFFQASNAISGANGVTLTSTLGSLSIAAVSSSAGSVSLTGAGSITANTITSAGSVTVSGMSASLAGMTAAGNISVTTSAGLIAHTAALVTTAGNISLSAGGTTSQGTYNNNSALTATGTVTLTTVGALYRNTGGGSITGPSGVTVQSTGSSISNSSAISASSGAISITAATSINMATGSTMSALNNITLLASNGGVTTSSAMTTTSGNVSITATGGTNGISTLGSINSNGTITITAPGSLSFTPSFIAGGDITITSTAADVTFYNAGSIAKTTGTSDATLYLYAATSVTLNGTYYAGSSVADSSANGKLNILVNPGRSAASGAEGNVTLGTNAGSSVIRTQGGYFTVVSGTNQSDYVLGTVSSSRGNPGLTIGGFYTFAIYTNGGNIKLFASSSATAASNTSGGIYIAGGMTLSSGSGSIVLSGIGKAASFSGIYSYCNACAGSNSITSTSGDITLIGTTNQATSSGITFPATVTITSTSGNIVLAGSNSYATNSSVNAFVVSIPSASTISTTNGSVTIQAQAANGYLSYNNSTYTALSALSAITAGTQILLQTDASLALSTNKLTSPDIDIVARTVSTFGTGIFVPGTGRVLVYLSNVTGSTYVASTSNPLSTTGATFTHYSSTCSYPGYNGCSENASAVLPTTNGTILISSSNASPTFTLNSSQTTPVLGSFTNSSVTYGASSVTKALTSTSNATVTYTSSNTAVATVNSSGVVSFVGAGTATITASQSSNIFYKAASASYGVTVSALPVTLSGSRTYSGLSTAISGILTVTNKVGSDTVTLSGTATLAAADVGTQSITSFSGLTLSNSNYTLTGASGSVTVTTAPLTITASSQSTTYGTALALGTSAFTTSGLVNSETISAVTLQYSGSATTSPTLTAGTYTNAIAPSAIVTSGNGFNASNYTITYANNDLVVGKAALTITADDVSKTYGDTVTFTGTEFTASGLKNGDTIGSVSLSSSGAAATAGVGSSPYSIVPSAASGGTYSSSNYTIAYATGALTVAKKALTVTAANASKTYDASAYSGGNGTTISGFVNNETSAVLGGTLAYSGTSQGAVNAGTYAITPSGYTATNYSFSYVSGTLTVSKATATVTAISDTYTYNGSARSASGFTASGLLGSDTVSSLTGVSVSGGGTNVGSYLVTPSGTATNYDLTFNSGTMTINKASATVTAASDTYTYNGLARTASGFSVSGLLGSDTASSLTGVSVSGGGTHAGTYTITASGTDTNYDLSFNTGTMTISAAPLTITASAATKVYDGLAYSGGNAVTYSGFVNGESDSNLSGTLSVQSTASGQVNVGTYAITASGLTSTDYAITYVAGQVTITKAPLTITASNASKTYDGLTYSGGNGVSYSGFVNSETSSVLGGTLSYGGSAQNAINAGTYAITASGLTSSNYDITYASGSLTVNKASAIVTANSDTYTYNGLQRVVSGYTVTGLVNGEASTVLTGISLSGSATNAGTYATTASGTDSNYNLTFVPGTLTINKAVLTVTAIDDAKFITQGDTAGYAGVSYSGFLNNETSTVISTAPTVTRSNSGVNTIGTYSGVLQASGAAATNYSFTYVDGNYTIVPAGQLLVRVSNVSTTYGTSASYTVSSAKYLDQSGNSIVDLTSSTTQVGNNVTVVDGLSGSANFTLGALSPQYSTGGQLKAASYSVGASSVTETSANFSDTLTVIGSLTVNKASLSSTIGVVTKTYDGSTSAGTVSATLAGLQTGDSVSATGVGTYDSKIVASGKTVTVTGLSLSGTDSENYSLTSSSATGTSGVITAKTLAVSGITASSKVYDGTTAATVDVSSAAFTGLVGGDDVSVSATGVFSTKSVGTGKTVVLTSAYSGTDYTNYAITDQATTTASITAKTLTLSGITASDKVYDGTTTATLDGTSATKTGLIVGDTVTVSATGTFSTSGVDTNKTVTFTPSLSGTDADNYSIGTGQTTTTASITAATVTLSGSSGVTKTYDGTTSMASGTTGYGSLNGIIGSDTVTVTGAPVFSSANAGARSVLIGTVALSGASAGNYTLSWTNGSGTIDKANATVTASSGSATYDGLVHSVTGFAASGLVNGETTAVLTGVSTSGSGTNAGTYAVTSSGTDSNYSLTFVAGTLTINKASLTVTAANASKTYDGLTYSGGNGVTYSGFVNSETSAVLGGTIAYSGTSQSAINAGTYVITPSGLTSSNYTLSYANGSLTVNKATAIVTASSDTYTYNGLARTASGFSATGLVNGEAATVLTGVSVTGGGTDAGSYLTTASGTDTNYTLSFVSGTMTINKAALTVTAANDSKTYNGLSYSGGNGVTYSGFVNSETSSVLGGTIAYSGTSQGAINAGTYVITPSGLTSSNYTLTYANGSLTVNKATATVTANSDTYTYNGLARTASGFTATGLVNGEASTVLTGVSVSGGGTNVGTYTTTPSGTDTNYTLSFVTGTMTINKAALTVTATDDSKTYDGLSYAGGNGVTYSGFVNGETSSVLGGGVVYSGTAIGAKNAGSYVLTPSGLISTNYALTYASGSLTISQAPLTITAVSDAKFVTQSDTAGYAGVVYAGFVNGETSTVLTTAPSISRSNSGTNSWGTYSGVLEASGAVGANYSISYIAGDYTIVPANELLVRLNTASVTYGTTASYDLASAKYYDSNGSAIVDLTSSTTRSGNTFTVIDGASGTAQFTIDALSQSLSSSGTLQVGSYSVGATGISVTSGNFSNTLTIVGSLQVNRAALTPSFNAVTKTYDSTTDAGTVSLVLADAVSGDSVSASGTGTYSNKNVGTGNKTVTVSGFSLSGTDAGNYYLSTDSLTSSTNTISAKALTVSGVTASDKIYDGTTTATISTSAMTLSGAAIGDDVSANVAGSFDTATVAVGKTVTLTTTFSGTDLSNYTATGQTTTTATISKASATVTANSDTYTYNGVARAASGFSATGLVNSETIAVLTGVSVSGGGTNVGTYITTASGTDTNYDLTFVAGSMTINKAALTVTAANDSKTYDGLSYSGGNGVTYSGFQNSETSTVLGGTLAYAGTSQNAVNAGTYTIIPSGLTASNYTISYANGSLTVNKASATVTAASDTYTYNGLSRSASGFTASGLVNGESSSVLTGVSVSSGGPNAGSYTITASGTDTNYDLTFVSGTMTINKAALTVTANSDTYTYNGSARSPSGFTASGLVNSETVSVLTGVSVSGGGTNVGTYTTTASGTDTNYDLTFVNGVMTIGAKALSISANARSTTSGTALALGTASFSTSGLAGSETISAVELLYLGSSTVASTVASGTYANAIIANSILTSGNGFLASNYSITFSNGTLTITSSASSSPVMTYSNGVFTNSSTTGVRNSFSATWIAPSGFSPLIGQNRMPSAVINLVANRIIPMSARLVPIGQAVMLDPVTEKGSAIASAYIDASPNFIPGQTELEVEAENSIIVKVDNRKGKINLDGIGSVEDYNKIIRSVQLRVGGSDSLSNFNFKIGIKDVNGREIIRAVQLRDGKVVTDATPDQPKATGQSSSFRSEEPKKKNPNTVSLNAMPSASLKDPAFGTPPLPSYFQPTTQLQ